MHDFKLDPSSFEQVLKLMNLKALFYSTVINKELEEKDDAALGRWLREYITTHKVDAGIQERKIWD